MLQTAVFGGWWGMILKDEVCLPICFSYLSVMLFCRDLPLGYVALGSVCARACVWPYTMAAHLEVTRQPAMGYCFKI